MRGGDDPALPGAIAGLALRRGHFLLESGLHADTWIDLDALFVEPASLAPQVEALAARLSGYDITAVCGPLLGGAFVAQAVATRLGLRFYVAERVASETEAGLFQARYEIAGGVKERAAGERFAIVDDVISAGSSVRASHAHLAGLGASVVVVGALVVLGNRATEYFAGLGLRVEAPAFREFSAWEPAGCPHCRAGVPLTTPA